MKKPLPAYLPFLLFFLGYLLPLGVRPIAIPDEARYAEIPREMLASGDWIVPRLNGLRYFEKPALGYWFNAASQKVFGQNAFAIRFTSAVSVGLTGILVFLLVHRYSRREDESEEGQMEAWNLGILASLVYLVLPEVAILGALSTLDSLFSMFLSASLVLAFMALLEPERRKRTLFFIGSGLAGGLACLTKGYLAFAVPVVTIVPFLGWLGRWKDILRLCWIPFLLAGLVSIPWYLAIQNREGDFWNYFFWVEHIRRFTSSTPQHPESFWYFFKHLSWAGLPWLLFLPAVIQGLRGRVQKNLLLTFSLCWFIFPFLFFSCSRGKLVTYILPCFPPFAVLVTVGLKNYLDQAGDVWIRRSLQAIAGLLGIAALLFLTAGLSGLFGAPLYRLDVEYWKLGVGSLAILASAVFHFRSIKVSLPENKITQMAIAPFFLLMACQVIIPDKTFESKAPAEFLMTLQGRVTPNTVIAADQRYVASACWVYKRNDLLVFMDKGELEYGLNYADSARRFIASPREFRELVDVLSKGKKVVLIIKPSVWKEIKNQMPKPSFELNNKGVAFLEFG
jgi:4-amino-4-deoxy-L-arabinose transferase